MIPPMSTASKKILLKAWCLKRYCQINVVVVNYFPLLMGHKLEDHSIIYWYLFNQFPLFVNSITNNLSSKWFTIIVKFYLFFIFESMLPNFFLLNVLSCFVSIFSFLTPLHIPTLQKARVWSKHYLQEDKNWNAKISAFLWSQDVLVIEKRSWG